MEYRLLQFWFAKDLLGHFSSFRDLLLTSVLALEISLESAIWLELEILKETLRWKWTWTESGIGFPNASEKVNEKVIRTATLCSSDVQLLAMIPDFYCFVASPAPRNAFQILR